MTRRVPFARALAVATAGLASVVLPGRAQQDPPRATFRSGASVVAVDVAVRQRNGRPVTGLEAPHFEVFDNGVPQTVDQVSYGKVPIDVTVALDISYSVTGALLDRLRRGVVRLMGDLRKEDRLKLLLFNMRVARTVDFTSDVAAVERAIREVTAGGGTSLMDAVSVALVSASDPDRRQLIVFFTDGSDSTSTTSPDMLADIAQRTRATLTFVMPISDDPDAPVIMTRVPFHAVFTVLARETGGSILPVGSGADLGAAFRTVLDQFRSTYVLYYTPRGVDRPGFHTIDVKVGRPGAQVQARRGYWR